MNVAPKPNNAWTRHAIVDLINDPTKLIQRSPHLVQISLVSRSCPLTLMNT